MKFLKKKKQKQIAYTSPIDTAIPMIQKCKDETLRIIYNDLQENYEKERDVETQQHLVLISKVMTDRAVGGNGHVKEYFMNKGMMTNEKWDKLTNKEKDSMSEMKDKMEKLNESIEELTNQPQNNKQESHLPPKEEIESIHNQADEIRERVELEVQKELKRKQIVHLDNVKVVEPLTIDKPKKGFGSLFKKKIPKMIEKQEMIEMPTPTLSTQLVPNVTHQITPDQKERAKIMEEATVKESKLKNLFNKDKKPKLELPEVFCPDCSHSIKAHQRKGVSVGCKCGCLQTIETIAFKHGVQLYSPKKVLDNVLEQESITKQENQELKQAEKLHTMTVDKKGIPKPTPNQTKPKPICVNCDHVARTHFEENGFCTVVGCSCETYRAYIQ